ncbi:MAG: hypothetical protein LUD77_06610 [Clostridiales bacterium]|nr:hypothetical protein [Clostridiales bacterium]
MSIVSDSEERPVGEYRGFKASVKFDSFSHEFNMILRNNATFTFPLGNDIYGNITRIDNAINSLDNKRSTYVEKLEALEKNAANTKAEIDKPFSRLDELHEKEQRLEKLNVELTMKNNDNDTPEKSDSEAKDKKDIPIKTNIPVKSEKKKGYAYR